MERQDAPLYAFARLHECPPREPVCPVAEIRWLQLTAVSHFNSRIHGKLMYAVVMCALWL